MYIDRLPTPALIVEESILRQNREAMKNLLAGSGLSLRPHYKTHKCAALAHWQIENGAIELGYAIHSDFWGMGCATGGLKLAISDLFRKGFREVICGAFEGNSASLRVMEKAGMAPLEKVDEIEYRGKTHRCIYYQATIG